VFIRTCDGLEEGRGDLVKNPGGEEGEHEDAAVGDLGGAAAIWARRSGCDSREGRRHRGFFRPREMWTAGRDQNEISFRWGIESRALLSSHITYSAWILYALRVL
jgi:hypothetical protein